jgi:glycosyltransferase involved in cell wall biosynthesis
MVIPHSVVDAPDSTGSAIGVTPDASPRRDTHSGGSAHMKVAIFTDNDFSKVNGVTTTLRAMLEHLPPEIHARVYTCESTGQDTANYLALESFGIGIPFYREMKIYLPPLRRLLRHARADGIDLIHLATPGPVGLAALYVGSRLGIPVVGSFHTDLAAYTDLLSGSRRLGRFMQEYMRWPYGKCSAPIADRSPADCRRRWTHAPRSDGSMRRGDLPGHVEP